MRRLVVVAVAALLLAGGCAAVQGLSATHCPSSRKLLPQGAADYIDFVQVGGVTYHAATRPESGQALRDGDLGTQVAAVRCKLAEHIVEDPAQRYLDGDAAYLDKGTVLYAVKGYRPTFRLAARRDGELALFEAAENPRAQTWGDLLDVAGKVRWIGINDGSNRPLAAIRDPQQVARLVELLLGSPSGSRRPAPTTACSWPSTSTTRPPRRSPTACTSAGWTAATRCPRRSAPRSAQRCDKPAPPASEGLPRSARPSAPCSRPL
jgi:hypothetical protein